MTGYDLDTANGTITVQYRNLTNMLSWDTALTLKDYAVKHPELKLGGYNLTFAHRFITPASVITQALIARYRQDPGNQALRNAINEYVKIHRQMLSAHSVDGSTLYDFLD